MQEAENPIHLICDSCGAPVRYEIGSGTYRCAHCGSERAPGDQYRRTQSWRKIRQDMIRKETLPQTAVFYHCPGCGAEVVVDENEASSTCSFCGGSLIRRDYTEKDTFPEMIIPFEITPQEAKEKMNSFAGRHLHFRQKAQLKKSLDEMQGYYLPYQFVRGPFRCDITRDISKREYHAAGYVTDLAVNTSSQLNNDVLDACEPFDWDKAKEFSFGYIAGHRIKMQDIDDRQVAGRVWGEAERDFLPAAEKIMQTKSLDVNAYGNELEQLPALLPLYFIRQKGMLAVLNGQTGAAAATFYKMSDRSRFWFVEPLLTTLLIGGLVFFLSRSYELTAYFAAAVALVAFIAFSQDRLKHEEMIIYSDKKKEKKVEPHRSMAVFREEVNGQEENVNIRFYTPGRIILLLLKAILFNTAPLFIALFLAWAANRPFDTLSMGYIVIWLVISIPVTFIFWIAYARRDIYDYPFIYLINEDGKQKRVRQKTAVSSLKTAFELIRVFSESALFVIFLIAFPILMFVMSIVLILD